MPNEQGAALFDDDVTILKAAFGLTVASWPWVVIRNTVLSPVMKRNS